MSSSPDHHCSDEVLLGYLDRELDPAERTRADSHLAACWLCRARLNEMDQTVQRVAGLLIDGLRSPDRAARAREGFLEHVQRFEKKSPVLSIPSSGKARWRIIAALATAAAVLIAIVGWTLRSRTTPVPLPVNVVDAASGAEHRQIAGAGVVHQIFGWEIDSSTPNTGKRNGRVEIWSEGEGQRYASRLFSGDGRLVHTVWTPNTGGRLIFPAAMIRDEPTGDNEKLEQRLVAWLENRPHAALFLADEFDEFCRHMQVMPVVERLGSTVRISAKKETNGITAEFILIVDASTSMPLRQVLRLSETTRSVEIRLSVGGVRAVSTEDHAVFYPPSRPSKPREVKPALPIEPAIAAAPLPTPGESLIELLYQLHRQGVCGEDSISIVRNAEGAPQLRILVRSEERKETLRASLSEAVAMAGIDTEIGMDSNPDRPVRKASLDAPVPHAAAEHALAVSTELFVHAWALQQIAELPEAAHAGRSSALLARMVRDHLSALQRLSGDMHGTFSAVLIPSLTKEGPVDLQDIDTEWQPAAVRLFRAAARVHDIANHVAGEDRSPAAPVRQSLQDLAGSLSTLSRSIEGFHSAFAVDFENKETTARKD